MRDAAAAERFEEAARHRNRLFAIRSLAERQAADKRAVGTVDVIGLAAEGDRAAVQVFPLRDGKMIDRYAFHLENVEGRDLETVLESFCLEYYGSAPSVPPQIIVPPGMGDLDALADFLSDLRGAGVAVRSPARGEKKRLAGLASENARLALEHDLSQTEQRRLRRVEALEQLRETLNLESLPLRIECFDVSNIQGASIVASMAVFQDAAPKKAHYRSFAVRGQEGQDDFAALAQVVSRRFARLREPAASAAWDVSFGATRTSWSSTVAVVSCPRRSMRSIRPTTCRASPSWRSRSGRRRCTSRAAPSRSCSSGTIPGSSSCSGSATRPTARRCDSIAAAATPRRSSRSSTPCLGSVPRAGAPSCDTSARPTASSKRARRSSRGYLASRPARLAPCTPSSTRPEVPARENSRLLLPLAVVVLLGLAGCSDDSDDGSAGGTTTTVAPIPKELDFPNDSKAGEVLDDFVQAAGAKDYERMVELLSTRSRQRYGDTPELFQQTAGNQLAIVLGAMARDGGSYEPVMAKRLSDTWSVAAIKGSVTANNRTEQGAYAVPLVRENGDLRIELAGTAQFNPVTPEPELKSDGKPSIATEITAGEPVIRSFVWVDDRPYRATLAPDEVLLTADVPTQLPPGRHVVVTYAETQSSSGANAYSFEVG